MSTTSGKHMHHTGFSVQSDGRPVVRAYTKSIEKVLLPIATQVGELMTLDERAREEGTGIPDLTQAAISVESAIQKLISVGESVMSEGDDLLKSHMPTACDQILAAGKLFKDAAAQLKENPFSTQSRQLLVKAARGLLDGTTNLLMTFDAYEVRKVIVIGEALIAVLTTAKTVTTMEALFAIVKDFSDNVVQLASLVEARHHELLNTSLKNKLVAANEALRKISPLLVTSLRTYVENRDLEQAKLSRDYAIDEAITATHEIIVCVGDTEIESPLITAEDTFSHTFDSAIAQFDGVRTETDVNTVDSYLGKLLRKSEEIAATTQSLQRSQTIKDATSQLREDIRTTQLSSASTQGSFVYVARMVLPIHIYIADSEHMQGLDDIIRTAIAEEVVAATIEHNEHTPSAKLVGNILKPDSNFDDDIREFCERTTRLVTVSKHACDVSKDTRRIRILETAANQIQGFTKQIISAAQVVRERPSDKSARQHLGLLRQTLDQRTEILTTTLSSMQDAPCIVSVAGAGTQTYLEQGLDAAQQGDINATVSKSNAVEKQVHYLLNVASAEMDNSEDPRFHEPIAKISHSIQQIYPHTIETLKILAHNPNDATCQSDAKSSSTALKHHIDTLRKAVQGETINDVEETATFPEKNTSSEKIAASSPSPVQTHCDTNQTSEFTSLVKDGLKGCVLFSEKSAVEDEDTSSSALMSRSEESNVRNSIFDLQAPPQGPIADAALSLKQETERWVENKNPIVSGAKAMAEQMASMAMIADTTSLQTQLTQTTSSTPLCTSNTGELIRAAKDIAEQATDFRSHALQVASNCSDKRLKADLLYFCDRLPTISTQLKIIASVKAASSSHSSDADAMLVKNAQNLMDTVQRTVRACEAASMKQFSTAVNTVMTAIKWRRKASRNNL
eukprot:gene8162-796_t